MPLWSFSDAVAGVGPDHGRAGPDANLAGGGGAATDMVDNPGSGPVGMTGLGAGFAFAAAPLDFKALAHLKWSPRQQPDRAPEVKRAVRDAVDRSVSVSS